VQLKTPAPASSQSQPRRPRAGPAPRLPAVLRPLSASAGPYTTSASVCARFTSVKRFVKSFSPTPAHSSSDASGPYHQTIMPRAPQPTSIAKPPVYLLDTMAFIFRAYHAMQRSRPMSTRTGIPTAATYVFVNMINKLRKDFAPEYLAAVYDVGAPLHRNELAGQLKDVKKFNIKTQQFETVEYGGYKANRTETPPDLIQQQPYIRGALEAFRIPILYYEGFEADDVIGTLSCKLAALGHKVYVVSSDKDMMQLVNRDVSILNPTKDNLILDSAGVKDVLGVEPARVEIGRAHV